MKYKKYKTRVKLILTGDDDLFGSNQSSTYQTTGSSYKNGKTISIWLINNSEKIYQNYRFGFQNDQKISGLVNQQIWTLETSQSISVTANAQGGFSVDLPKRSISLLSFDLQ